MSENGQGLKRAEGLAFMRRERLVRLSLRFLVAIAALAVALQAAPAAYAQTSAPCGAPVFTGHSSGFFRFDKLIGLRPCGSTYPPPACDYEISASISVLGEPAVSSGNTVALCTEAAPAESSGGPCQPEAGTALDGQFTLNDDWSNPAIAGCPAAVTTGLPDGSP